MNQCILARRRDLAQKVGRSLLWRIGGAGSLLSLLLVLCATGTAQAASLAPHPLTPHLVKMITGPDIPAATSFWAFDIGWVDARAHRYYLADASNRRVDVFDTQQLTYLGNIAGFSGFDGNFGDFGSMGPSGVVGDGHGHLFVGDGNSTLKIITLDSTGVKAEHITAINTGGKARVDELAYSPQAGGLIVAANSGDSPPFLSLISVPLQKVLAHRIFPDATNGLEQPLIDQELGVIDVTIPSTLSHPDGEVEVLSPALTVLQQFALPPCQPNGEALGAHQVLGIGCSVGHPLLLHVLTGQIEPIPQLTNAGTDVVQYDARTRCYYFAAAFGQGGPVVAVVGADGDWLTALSTAPFAHSVAVDPTTNQVWVPMGGRGIGVFSLTR